MDENVAAFAAWLKGTLVPTTDGIRSNATADENGNGDHHSVSSADPPEVDPTLEDMDKLLAEELNQMNLEERELMYEEIHGVEKNIEETPELLQAKIEELGQEILKIEDKAAYDQAERQCPEYVNSPKMRLMFLRAEYFDAPAAATRMVKFYQHKFELFGSDALARPLRLSDMDDDDIACMKKGTVQMLPVRDRAGRLVFADLQKPYAPAYKHVTNMVSLLFLYYSFKFRKKRPSYLVISNVD